MRVWPFRKKSAQMQGIDDVWVIPGIGKIVANRLNRLILAQKLSDVVATCISLIQRAAKRVPWYVYQRQGDRTVEIKKGPGAEFLRRPGKRLSWSKFIDFYYAHILLTGDAFIRQIVPEYKTKIDIQFLRPDLVTLKKTATDEIIYEYKSGKTKFTDQEIIHIWLPNPEYDGETVLRGLSPIASIAINIDIDNYAKEWMFRLLEGGAQSPLTLYSEQPLTEDQRTFLKDQLKREYIGPQNAKNPLILEMMKPMRVGFSPKELEYDPILKAMLRRVASRLHVPTELLGDVEHKTYANAKEAVASLYQWAVLPDLASLKDELNYRIIPQFDSTGSMFFDYDISGIEALTEELNGLWQRIDNAVDRGIISREEARQEIRYGMSKEPAAAKLTVTANVVPLDLVIGGETEKE